MKISAIVVIHGNPPYAFESLKSIVDHVDEIIVGDVGMTFNIPREIAKKTTIITCSPQVPFADMVKEQLKAKAKSDYILYIDPDEIVPDTLWQYLMQNISKADYFLLPRKNIIFDKWITHSNWWPDYQVRFFKKNAVVWPATIHPIPHVTGKKNEVPAEERYSLLHYNYDSISHYLEKMVRYAKYEAQSIDDEKNTVTLAETIKKSLHEYISRFFLHDGYKNGMHGFVLAFLQMFYYFLVYFFYWENHKYRYADDNKAYAYAEQFFRKGLFEINYWMAKKNISNIQKKIKSKITNILLK